MGALQSFGAAVFIDMSGLLERIKAGPGIQIDAANGSITISATGGAVVPTKPATPTGSFNASTRLLTLAHALGVSELLVSVNNGPFAAAASLTLNLGAGARAASYVRAKVKAAAGRLESDVYSSEAIDAANAAPTITAFDSSALSANAGDVITFSATAADSDGTVSNIKVYDGWAAIGTISGGSGTVNSLPLTAGKHYFKAQATDNKGAVSSFSQEIVVTVSAVFNTMLDHNTPIADGMSFVTPGSDELKFDTLATSPSGPIISVVILKGGVSSYLDYNSEFAGKEYAFGNPTDGYISGTFPSSDTTVTL